MVWMVRFAPVLAVNEAIPLNTFFEVSQAIQTEHTTGNLSEEQAASKIQALYRGKMARRHVADEKRHLCLSLKILKRAFG